MKTAAILAILCLMSCKLPAKELHVLLSADTISNVKKASKRDLENLQKELLFISSATGMPLRTTLLKGSMLSIASIQAWLKNEVINPDDVVLIYYTGHGFRTKKSPSIWPYIYLPATKEAIDINDLVRALTTKPAALYITIADCCNNLIKPKIQARFTYPHSFAPSSQAHLTTGYRKLFLESRGIIIASGSKPKKRSWATAKGGIFTNAFLLSLKNEAAEHNPDWKRLFKKVKFICKQYQKPQFKISMGN
ncbi:MAG: hypothetical protein JWO53_812 [Chlamydiia bacterium]|nr:hypothetical protein [Chlamydiia bacterium]